VEGRERGERGSLPADRATRGCCCACACACAIDCDGATRALRGASSLAMCETYTGGTSPPSTATAPGTGARRAPAGTTGDALVGRRCCCSPPVPRPPPVAYPTRITLLPSTWPRPAIASGRNGASPPGTGVSRPRGVMDSSKKTEPEPSPSKPPPPAPVAVPVAVPPALAWSQSTKLLSSKTPSHAGTASPAPAPVPVAGAGAGASVGVSREG